MIVKVNLMTWNTRLYEYGNIDNKTEEDGKRKYDADIKKCISKHLEDTAEDTLPIVVLQEIPYKIKAENGWRLHDIYNQLIHDFKEYDIVYLKEDEKKKYWHIKMTVIIAPTNTILECENKTNIFVPFKIKNNNAEVYVLGLHSHNADEVKKWLGNHQDFNPDIIIGDFNAGDYEKTNESKAFKNNRENYRKLLESGYVDICEGKNTRKIVLDNGVEYKTPIDHILVKDGLNFKNEFCSVDDNNNLSDHYPIYYSFEIEHCEKYLDAEEYPIDKEQYPYAYECTKCGRVVKNEEMHATPDMCDECSNR